MEHIHKALMYIYALVHPAQNHALPSWAWDNSSLILNTTRTKVEQMGDPINQ